MREIVDVKFYYIEEISRELGLNEKTVRRYIKSGRIDGMKLGNRWLISERAFRDFLRSLKK